VVSGVKVTECSTSWQVVVGAMMMNSVLEELGQEVGCNPCSDCSEVD